MKRVTPLQPKQHLVNLEWKQTTLRTENNQTQEHVTYDKHLPRIIRHTSSQDLEAVVIYKIALSNKA